MNHSIHSEEELNKFQEFITKLFQHNQLYFVPDNENPSKINLIIEFPNGGEVVGTEQYNWSWEQILALAKYQKFET